MRITPRSNKSDVSHRVLPTPAPGRAAAEAFVSEHLEGLYQLGVTTSGVLGSDRFRGGQGAADEALERFEVSGYASSRNGVFPDRDRGASALSPYIRHGLLSLREVWDRVEGGPDRDVAKFRDQLLWQEYARHWYARLGGRTRRSVRHERVSPDDGVREPGPHRMAEFVEQGMACLELSVEELDDDGWIPNQSRLWLAGHWSNRRGLRWQDGEEALFRQLIDGSRAANRLGWQWASGASSTKPYEFTRWQVEERAAGLCATCDLVHACPIEQFPPQAGLEPVEQPVTLRRTSASSQVGGPADPLIIGTADVVWLTAESLGARDPALAAHPELPAVFVFDRSLLERLQLAPIRLVFLVESLAELAASRSLEIHLGEPIDALRGRQTAVTYAPVPGFRRKLRRLEPAALHPWPWLLVPNDGSLVSFSAWLKTTMTDRNHRGQQLDGRWHLEQRS